MVLIIITFARVYLGVGDGGLSLVQDHPDFFDVDTSIPQNTHTQISIYRGKTLHEFSKAHIILYIHIPPSQNPGSSPFVEFLNKESFI